MANPLVSDAFVDFLLDDVLDVAGLLKLPYFAMHGPETIRPWLAANRRLAREVLFPAYRAMDEAPARLVEGRVLVHPLMRAHWQALTELGVLSATRPLEVGGQQLPLTVSCLSTAYLMAGNLSSYGFAGLTTGAAHLIETFGNAEVRAMFLAELYEGRWTGTMALTEPQAGSSLADVTCSATPTAQGHHLLRGSKIFISGGDQDFAANVVHLVLARLPQAPAGTKGISLFAVPKLRREGDALVPNDVAVTGLIHKIGWRGLPSCALALGEEGDCRGFMVGAPHQGLKCMFQMMNEARLMVGTNAAATASVAFHQSLAYAQERRQGRPLGVTDPTAPQVALVEHADVRRMLLRQKAIVEGSLGLLGVAARYADLAEHSPDETQRAEAKLLVDLLTPIAKSFPAEKGFEANALALQIHGGYGYSSEYLPEAWLRDQKLNTIHEGTSTIQGLDLLGRKVVAGGGAALVALDGQVKDELARARVAGIAEAELAPLTAAMEALLTVTATLGANGAAGQLEAMLGHSSDYLELASLTVVGWVWLKLATAAASRTDDFGLGLKQAFRYWSATELPRVPQLAALCASAERSYLDWRPEA